MWASTDLGRLTRPLASNGDLADAPIQSTSASDTESGRGQKNTIHTRTNPAQDLDVDHAPTSNAQPGVKQAEAITLVWTKKDLIVTYAL